MPQRLETVDDLQLYLRGVNDRAVHHAGNVSEVVLALVGAVALFKDGGSEIEVRTHEGEMANVLWVHVAGRRLAFAYNHAAAAVEVRERTQRGPAIAAFFNSTPTAEILRFFESIGTTAGTDSTLPH